MKKVKIGDDIQRMTVYFPRDLLAQVHESARVHKRSFNKQVLWLVEQSLAASFDASKLTTAK